MWGAIVNDSRSFARMVLTFFGTYNAEITALQHRMVRRHIAWLYALKARLRGDAAPEYATYLAGEECERIGRAAHPGNTLLELQGRDLDTAERAGHIDVIRMARYLL